MEPLREWLTHHGVEVDPRLALVQSDNSVHVIARAPIPPRETVARIPRSIVLSRKTSALARALTTLDPPVDVDRAPFESLAPPVVLAIHVLYELAQGSASTWAPYLESCPRDPVDIALVWHPTGTARRWIVGTQLERHLDHVRVDPNVLARVFTCVVEPVFALVSPPLAASRVSHSTFVHAYSLVCSRAFAVDHTYHGLSLVPFADAFDHAPPGEHDVEMCVDEQWVCPICGTVPQCPHDLVDDVEPPSSQHDDDDDDDVIEMVTTARGIEAGQEVYNSYGPLANARLVAEYGFKLEANPFDRVEFARSDLERLVGSVQTARAATRARNLDGSEDHPLIADPDGPTAAAAAGQREPVFSFDADAKVSRDLWVALVASLGGHAAREEELFFRASAEIVSLDEGGGPDPPSSLPRRIVEGLGRVATLVHALCDGRLAGQSEPELTASQLLDLAEEETDARVRLAIEFVAEERLLLERVRENWNPFVRSNPNSRVS
ncbi:hypothetical protein JCM11491_003428 [Sporobolomyces phaffii]